MICFLPVPLTSGGLETRCPKANRNRSESSGANRRLLGGARERGRDQRHDSGFLAPQESLGEKLPQIVQDLARTHLRSDVAPPPISLATSPLNLPLQALCVQKGRVFTGSGKAKVGGKEGGGGGVSTTPDYRRLAEEEEEAMVYPCGRRRGGVVCYPVRGLIGP